MDVASDATRAALRSGDSTRSDAERMEMTPGISACSAGDDAASAVVALLESEGLEADFVAQEFTLLFDEAGRVVACARLKPLDDGSHELASVAVRADMRGRRVGERLVGQVLANEAGPVHAIALAPGFFERQGFVRVEETPAPLRQKMDGVCTSSGAVAMTWRR